MIEIPFSYIAEDGSPASSKLLISTPISKGQDLFGCDISAPELGGKHACEGTNPVETIANACIFIQAFLSAPNKRVTNVSWA